MFTPLRCHWKTSGGVPDALTLKDAGRPTETVTFAGWDVIAGAWLAV